MPIAEFKEMKKFIKNFICYVLPEFLVLSLPFLTLPITTRYFGLEEFGLIALFSLCQLPFVVLREFGVGYSLPAMWFDLDQSQRKSFLFTLLIVSLAITIISIILVSFLYEWVFVWLANDSATFVISMYPWMALSVFSQFVTPVFSHWVVITERSSVFMRIKFLELILSNTAMVLVIVYSSKVEYVIISMSLSVMFVNCIRLLSIFPHLNYDFDRKFFSEILTIGYPIFFRSFFNQLRGQVDKVFVSSLFSVQTFALYSWSFRFYQMFNTLNGHFSKVYSPRVFQKLSKEDFDFHKINRMLFFWFYFIFLGSVLFFFLGKPLINVISNGVYLNAYPIILLFSGLCLVETAFCAVDLPITQKRKTKYILGTTIFGSLIGLLSAFLLVPEMGPIGAVLSLIISSFLIRIINSMIKFRMTRILFIELRVTPYVIAYFVAITLHFAGLEELVPSLLLTSMTLISLHWVVIERKSLLTLWRRLNIQ